MVQAYILIQTEVGKAHDVAVSIGKIPGVIRVDGNLKVTIANASAQTLLDFVQRPGESTDLGEIAPEFVES